MVVGGTEISLPAMMQRGWRLQRPSLFASRKAEMTSAPVATTLSLIFNIDKLGLLKLNSQR